MLLMQSETIEWEARRQKILKKKKKNPGRLGLAEDRGTMVYYKAYRPRSL